jgi:hypothetical protein
MATCKECVHVGVCRYYTNELAKANGIPLKLEEVERLLECDDCENFKDRSRFVELPFPISEGTKLFYIFEDLDDEIKVGKNRETVTRVCKDGFYVSGALHSDGTYSDDDYFYPWDAIGTEYFFTLEEAERVLKEIDF